MGEKAATSVADSRLQCRCLCQKTSFSVIMGEFHFAAGIKFGLDPILFCFVCFWSDFIPEKCVTYLNLYHFKLLCFT